MGSSSKKRRKRHRDIVSIGSSKLTSHLVNEQFRQRHSGRLGIAHDNREWLAASVSALGLVLINNEQHWRVYFNEARDHSPLVEWWPSTAKCVIFQRWGRGIHVHDVEQLLTVIQKLVNGGVVIEGVATSYANCAKAIAMLDPHDFRLPRAEAST
jgi:hypothetical protein